MIKWNSLFLFLSFFSNFFAFGQSAVYRIDTVISSTDSCIYHITTIIDAGNQEGQIVNTYSAKDCYYLTGEIKQNYFSQSNKERKSGVYYAFYKNGKVKEFYYLINDRKEGHYVKCNNEGKPLVVGHYKAIEYPGDIKADTIVYFDHGAIIYEVTPRFESIKDGEWYYYDYQQKIITKEYWEDGTLLYTEVVQLQD